MFLKKPAINAHTTLQQSTDTKEPTKYLSVELASITHKSRLPWPHGKKQKPDNELVR